MRFHGTGLRNCISSILCFDIALKANSKPENRISMPPACLSPYKEGVLGSRRIPLSVFDWVKRRARRLISDDKVEFNLYSLAHKPKVMSIYNICLNSNSIHITLPKSEILNNNNKGRILGKSNYGGFISKVFAIATYYKRINFYLFIIICCRKVYCQKI